MIYLFGGLLIVSGTLVVFGAVSGRLAAMLGAMVGIGQVTTSGGPLMVPTPGVKYTGDSWSSPPGTTPTSVGTPTAPEIGNPSVPELPPVG